MTRPSLKSVCPSPTLFLSFIAKCYVKTNHKMTFRRKKLPRSTVRGGLLPLPHSPVRYSIFKHSTPLGACDITDMHLLSVYPIRLCVCTQPVHICAVSQLTKIHVNPTSPSMGFIQAHHNSCVPNLFLWVFHFSSPPQHRPLCPRALLNVSVLMALTVPCNQPLHCGWPDN